MGTAALRWLLPFLAAAAGAQQPPAADRITLGDLRTPVQTLRPEEAQQLLAGAVVVRRGDSAQVQRWTNQRDGTVVSESFTRQGRPLSEFGAWRVNEQGQYCVAIDWLLGPEAWCRHVVRNQDGYYLAEGLALTDAVQRYEVTAAE